MVTAVQERMPHREPPSGLTDGERRWLWATELPFVVVAAAVALLVEPGRDLDPTALLLVLAGIAIASRVHIPIGRHGHASAVQLGFVPALFVLPLGIVLPVVAFGLLLGGLPAYAVRRKSFARGVNVLGDSWFAVGPVVVLAAAGTPAFDWGDWPLYLLALGAQVTIDQLIGPLRYRLATGERAGWVLWPLSIDLGLSLPALAVVDVAQETPVAAALTVASLLAVALAFAAEHAGRVTQRHHATHDSLTGLPNRLLFSELATAAATQARRDGEPRALLLIDLDGFKQVNDTLGHEAGDELLLEAGKRLAETVRSADTVARLGGDEFAVLLGGGQDAASAETVAAKIRDALSAPFTLTAGECRIGASVGTAALDGAGDVSDALRTADLAMYDDKRARRR